MRTMPMRRTVVSIACLLIAGEAHARGFGGFGGYRGGYGGYGYHGYSGYHPYNYGSYGDRYNNYRPSSYGGYGGAASAFRRPSGTARCASAPRQGNKQTLDHRPHRA